MDDAADKILDLLVSPPPSHQNGISWRFWLQEEGIFDALVRRRLAAVQFSVTTDKERPDTAVETYTITLGSADGYGTAVVLGAGLDCCFDEVMGHAVSIGEVDKDIDSMRRRLATLDEAPELPGILYVLFLMNSWLTVLVLGHRALGVELFYTDDCPKRYRAHGFADVDSNVDSEVLLFPVDQAAEYAWARVSDLYGLINCGFHM
jgi:HORMA domain